MLRLRLAILTGTALALSGCLTSLPTPEYVVKTPAPYRTSPDGARIDNENVTLDAEGYRTDKQGDRVGMIDVQAKTAGEQSNPVAGYYISSTNSIAPGKVASVNDGTIQTTPTGVPIQMPAPPAPPAGAPPVPTPSYAPSPATTAITNPPAATTPAPSTTAPSSSAPKTTTPPATGAPTPLSR